MSKAPNFPCDEEQGLGGCYRASAAITIHICFDSLNYVNTQGSTKSPSRWMETGRCRDQMNNDFCPRCTQHFVFGPIAHSGKHRPQRHIGELLLLPDGCLFKTQYGVLMRLKGDQMSQVVQRRIGTPPLCIENFVDDVQRCRQDRRL